MDNKKYLETYMRDLLSAGVELKFTEQGYSMVYNEFDKFEIRDEYGKTVKQYNKYSNAEKYIFNN